VNRRGSDSEKARRFAEPLVERGLPVEEVISSLRRAGFSKIPSIVALSDLLRVSRSEAKQWVDESDAWRDRYESDKAFHDALEEYIERQIDADAEA
jgi:hypothetical protein